MNDINCNACEELLEHAYEFAEDGVTDNVCSSLQNDTGFNPGLAATYTDCEDLDLANDCLIGKMDGELKDTDPCELKPFLHRLIPNMYNLYKAIICAICGLWSNVHKLWQEIARIWAKITDIEAEIQRIWQKINEIDVDSIWTEIRKIWQKINDIDLDPIYQRLATIESWITNVNEEITRIWNAINNISFDDIWTAINKNVSDITNIFTILNTINERIEDLCGLVGQSMTKNLNIYGMNIGTAISGQTGRSGGEIMSKDNVPAASPRSIVGDYDSLGIEYLKKRYKDCDGETTKTYEWILPRFHCYTLASNYTLGDVVWRVSKTRATEWGITSHLWNTIEQYPQWWRGFGNSVGTMKEFTLRLDISGNWLRLSVVGSDSAPEGAYIDSSPGTPNLFIS